MRALLLLLLVGCPGDWTRGDTAREAALLGTTLIDWHQTRSVVVPNCSEQNPILGSCGQNVDVDMYFAGSIALEMVVVRVLPHRYREAAHWVLIGVEADTVWRNYGCGDGF